MVKIEAPKSGMRARADVTVEILDITEFVRPPPQPDAVRLHRPAQPGRRVEEGEGQQPDVQRAGRHVRRAPRLTRVPAKRSSRT